jgi:hypothetical protein
MLSQKWSSQSRTGLSLAALLVLAACGGGSDSQRPAPTQPVADSIRLATTYTDLAEGASNGRQNWPDGSGSGSAISGVGCATTVRHHIHSLVSIYQDGTRMAVPESIGLKGCTYEMHTHDRTGIVHVETDMEKKFTLGQFFALWGQPIARAGVAGLPGPARFYIIQNETLTPYDGNPSDIEFAGHKEIVIITGTAPAEVPRHRWAPGL